MNLTGAGFRGLEQLPAVFDAGGLVSYGTSPREATKHMAVYADKILKGAKPEESPSLFKSCPRNAHL
jgi:ABC-type uncharacterized transport system substrate-binding protein